MTWAQVVCVVIAASLVVTVPALLAQRWILRTSQIPPDTATVVGVSDRGVVVPPGATFVELAPLGRVDLVRDVRPGDEILVWAHDHQSPLEADPDGELWKHGIVSEIHQGIVPSAWRSTTVVFTSGRRVHTMPQAKTFLVARHGPAAAVETVDPWDCTGLVRAAQDGAPS